MALPVTLSSPTIAVHNAYHGPFKSSGGNFYTILCGTTAMSSVWAVQDGDNIHVIFTHDSTATRNLTAWKATDPTSSFAEQDTSNRPSTGGSDSELFYARFDMSSDAWVDLGTSDFEIQIDAAGTTQLDTACTIGVRSDGDIVVAYNGDSEMLMGSEFERVDFNVSTDNGATWAGPTSLDNAGTEDWTGCVIVPGSSDRMHAFFKNDTNDDAYQRTIRSNDSLETFPSSFDTAIHNGNYSFGHGVSYDDGGTQRVRCPYMDVSPDHAFVAKFDSADTPTLSTDDASDQDINVGSYSLSVNAKDLQLLYSNNADNDLYRNTNDDDAGWTADNEELDAVSVTAPISTNVYVRSSNNRLAYIYSDGGTVKYNEVDLGVAPNTETLAVMAVGFPLIQIKVKKNIAATTVGVPLFIKKVPKTLSVTAIGVSTLAANLKSFVTLAAAAIGIPTLSTKTIFRTILAATSIGIPRFVKKVGKNISVTAVAVPNFTKKVGKTLTAVAVGIATSAENFIAGAANTITMAATATDIATLNAVATFRRSISATAVGVPSFQKKVSKSLSVVAIGVPNIIKKAKISLAVVATAIPDFTVKVGKILEATATGIASLSARIVSLVTISATAVGIVRITRKVSKGISATAIGLANFQVTVGKTLRATAIGVPNFQKKVGKILKVTAIGVATSAEKFIAASVDIVTMGATAVGIALFQIKVLKNISATAVGIPKVTKKIPKVLVAMAVGVSSFQIKVLKTLSATTVGLANFKVTVGKRLRVTAVGIASLSFPGGAVAAKTIIRWYKGLFGGPGKTAGK